MFNFLKIEILKVILDFSIYELKTLISKYHHEAKI